MNTFTKLFKNRLTLLIIVLAISVTIPSFLYSITTNLPENIFTNSGFNPQRLPAFPGAEGYGALAKGGRGGKVIKVTNLNDSGAGSLRSCVDASGARTCIFEVGGTIVLKSSLSVKNPYLTIAGQTAPGDGITIANQVFSVDANDVIIRYVRMRLGHASSNPSNGDPLRVGRVQNVILDHLSLSWSTDEVFDNYGDNITLQWSIISEALNCSTNSKGCHSKGVLLIEYGNQISLHHNLLAHNVDRNFMAKNGTIQFVNNVIYNPLNATVFAVSPSTSSVNVDIIGNFYKEGSQKLNNTEIVLHDGSLGPVRLFYNGNLGKNRQDYSQPESKLLQGFKDENISSTRLTNPKIDVTATTAQTAFEEVLASAGNSKPFRDSVDSRIVKDARYGSGKIINSEAEVGGWPILRNGTPQKDSDNDGMSDEWEDRYKFNKDDISDGSKDADGDGYTNLEEYLNSTFPINLSPWKQDNWVAGNGQNNWDNTSKFKSANAVDTSTNNQIKSSIVEYLSNGDLEKGISGWQTKSLNTTSDIGQVSNLAAWFKAETITVGNNELIGTWTDSSTKRISATQIDSEKQPKLIKNAVNNKPVVRTDGDDYISIPRITIANDFTLIWVGKYNTAQIDQSLIGDGDNVTLGATFTGTGKGAQFRTATNTLNMQLYSSPLTNKYDIWSFQKKGTTVTYYRNGQIATSAGPLSSPTSALNIDLLFSRRATFGFLNGDTAEFILFDTALSNPQRGNIEKGLAEKYNIPESYAPNAISQSEQRYNETKYSIKISDSPQVLFFQNIKFDNQITYSFEGYVYSGGQEVQTDDVQLYAGKELTTAISSAGNGWYKLSAQVKSVNGDQEVGILIKNNKTIYLDQVKLNSLARVSRLESSIFDTQQQTDFGNITYLGETPANTSIQMRIRTSKNSDMSGARSFSDCDPISSGQDISANGCVANGHRYVQYQVSLLSSDTKTSPTLTSMNLDFKLDTTGPTGGISSQGRKYSNVSNVKFGISGSDNIDSQASLQVGTSLSSQFSDPFWHLFSSSISENICTSEGEKKVHMKLKDTLGNLSSLYSASIICDLSIKPATALKVINPDAKEETYTNSKKPSFGFTIEADTLSGIQKHQIYIKPLEKEERLYQDNIPVSDKPETVAVGTNELEAGEYEWYVKSFDNAGNSSNSARMKLIIDNTVPTVEIDTLNGISEFETTPTPTTPDTVITIDNGTLTISGKVDEASYIDILLQQIGSQSASESDKQVPLESYTCSVKADEAWQCDIKKIKVDNYTLVLTAVDLSGNKSTIGQIKLNLVGTSYDPSKEPVATASGTNASSGIITPVTIAVILLIVGVGSAIFIIRRKSSSSV